MITKKKFWVAAALAFALSAGSAEAATTYARDLHLGSSGADVASLQTLLESKGFLVMPAGVAKGYFGNLTKVALAKWQASVGIAPAAGYFGPITRARVNLDATAPEAPSNGNPKPSQPQDSLRGGEGDIREFRVLGNPGNGTLREGESERVLGFEFEARGSDLRVERVEVQASSTAASESEKPWRYFESATLYHGSKKVADVGDLDDEDAWDEEGDDIYTFRFEDVDSVVDQGDKDRWYVELDVRRNLDSDDTPGIFIVSLSDDGLRAVDAEGIDLYAGRDEDGKTVRVEEAQSGDLELSIDEDDNEDRTVFVDEDNETRGVEVLRFTVESKSSSNTIDELTVSLATTTATATQLSEVIRNLTLEVDGDEVGSESVRSGQGPISVCFDDLDLEVDEDNEIEIVVLADIDEQEGNYGEGFAFEASVSGSGIDAEDAEGDDVSVSGSVTGGEIELRTAGIQIDYVSSSASRTNGSVSGDADNVEFKINFKVTASGEDVYLDGDTVFDEAASSSQDGVAWSTSTDSSVETTGGATAIVTASNGYKSSDVNVAGDKRFKISKGNSRSFTLTVSIPTDDDNRSLGMQVNGFKWGTDSADAMDNLYAINLNRFRTDVVTGLQVR